MIDVAPDEPRPTTRTRLVALARLGALLGLIAVMLVLFRYTPVGELLSEERIGTVLGRLGPFAYPLWILVYAVLIGLWIPGTPLTLLGAAVFGPVVAIPLNYAGAVIGAVIGFVIARGIGGNSVEQLLARRFPLYGRYEDLLNRRGFEAVLYLRLIPTPYTLLSYLAGLSPVPLRRYTLATAIGIIPGSIAFTYLFGRIVEAARGDDLSALWDARTLLAVGAYGLAASIPAIVGVGRRRFGWFRSLGPPE